jgi:hypothetical protein
MHPRRDSLEAELAAAAAAMDGAAPSGPEPEAYFALQKRWTERPHGRDAEPGDLTGWWLPGEYPHGGDIRCRRCGAVSSMEGHPYGCPRTPSELGYLKLDALRLCYCGQSLVVTPDMFGPCCQDSPPVRVPDGCRWCGSDLCRVNDPDELPEKDWYVPSQSRRWATRGSTRAASMRARSPRQPSAGTSTWPRKLRNAAGSGYSQHLPLGVLNP